MSEIKTPAIIYTKKVLLDSDGKKQPKISIKIELFPATFWSHSWAPGDDRFFPKPPLRSLSRKRFWQTRYRVRLGGRWVGSRKYTFMTEHQAMVLSKG